LFDWDDDNADHIARHGVEIEETESMKRKSLIPLRSVADVPPDMTEQQARECWDTHGITEEYLRSAGPISDDDLPFMNGIAEVKFWLPEDTFQRLKALARKRHTSYRTVLVEPVTERLGKEEKREGLMQEQQA